MLHMNVVISNNYHMSANSIGKMKVQLRIGAG